MIQMRGISFVARPCQGITVTAVKLRQQPARAAGSPVYPSKIIKAAARWADTRPLLAQWDESQALRENLERFRRENLFGKASRSRVEDILAIFQQRYLGEESRTRALVLLGRGGFGGEGLDRILYFHSVQAD